MWGQCSPALAGGVPAQVMGHLGHPPCMLLSSCFATVLTVPMNKRQWRWRVERNGKPKKQSGLYLELCVDVAWDLFSKSCRLVIWHLESYWSRTWEWSTDKEAGSQRLDSWLQAFPQGSQKKLEIAPNSERLHFGSRSPFPPNVMVMDFWLVLVFWKYSVIFLFYSSLHCPFLWGYTDMLLRVFCF